MPRSSSLLSTVFLFDIELLGGHLTAQPKVSDFVGRLVTGLQPLWSMKSDVKNGSTETDSPTSTETDGPTSTETDGPTSAVDVDDLAVSLANASVSPDDSRRDENETKDGAVIQLLKTGRMSFV